MKILNLILSAIIMIGLMVLLNYPISLITSTISIDKFICIVVILFNQITSMYISNKFYKWFNSNIKK